MGPSRPRDVAVPPVVVQLEATGEPIRGSVGGGTGETRRFQGWLGLVSALQEAIDDVRTRPERAQRNNPRRGE